MDYLISFAELSLGLAGVAAIIMLLVDKQSNKWNDFQFAGLLGHAIVGFFFSVFPFFVNAFTSESAAIWSICSFLLATQILFQVIIIQIIDKQSSKYLKLQVFLFGLVVSIVLFMNAFNTFFNQTMEAYFIGIIFHLVQASLIFFIFLFSSMPKPDIKQYK